MKQYNEQDVLKAIAGSYQPGFLQIKLTHSFDGGLARFSQKELGTFLHEYVHFLQNISTPWGLYMSMVQYQTLAKTFAFIQESSQEIELPLRIREAELDRKWSIIKLGSGYYPFSRADEHLCKKIDRSKDIVIHRTKEQIGSNQFPKIALDYTDWSIFSIRPKFLKKSNQMSLLVILLKIRLLHTSHTVGITFKIQL